MFPTDDVQTLIAFFRGSGDWMAALVAALHVVEYALGQLKAKGEAGPALAVHLRGMTAASPTALADALEAAQADPTAVDWKFILKALLAFLGGLL